MDQLNWTGAELARRAKGDARKIHIAQRLRAETAVTLNLEKAVQPQMDADGPNAACAATTDESRKEAQKAQRQKSFVLCPLRFLWANSLPKKQRLAWL